MEDLKYLFLSMGKNLVLTQIILSHGLSSIATVLEHMVQTWNLNVFQSENVLEIFTGPLNEKLEKHLRNTLTTCSPMS